MKGITPVIAIILLLLITISMVGFAFVWFNRMMISSTSAVENQTNLQLKQAGQKISIDIATSAGFYIRNTGTVSMIPASDINVYFNGVKQICTWTACSTMAPGMSCSCGPLCSAGQTVRVTAPGNYDELTCTAG